MQKWADSGPWEEEWGRLGQNRVSWLGWTVLPQRGLLQAESPAQVTTPPPHPAELFR